MKVLLREHQQKTFVMLSGFWLLRGWGSLSKSVKKENSYKNLASILMTKSCQNVKCNVKKVYIFHLILFGILSILILSIKNRGVGGLLLNGHNLLSMTKVIC